MLSYHADHIERIRTAIEGVYGLANLDQYIEKKTYLNGKLFSFDGHEFQREIVKGTCNTEITVKIAQVGLSEITYRYALAACRILDDFSVIYTFPNASDSEKMCKTRIDPIISGSPDLAQSVNKNLNNSEIKQFGRNSFLYMKGTRSEAGAISVPADMVIHDEWDRSDVSTASMYIARMQHKPYKLRRLFSTPTVAKYGISKEAETARRLHFMPTCQACNHKWIPSYFEDVKVPGFDGDLRDITKQNLRSFRWQAAYIACPRCGKDPKISYQTGQWVCENPTEDWPSIARFITPFVVPTIITPSYLVKNSTEYEKYSEFMNQGLGLVAEDEQESLTKADIEAAGVDAELASSELHVFSADMGLVCHAVVGRETLDGTMVVVHKERIPLAKFEARRMELMRQYNCVTSVMDSQPYVDMISRITGWDPNAHGALFTTFASGPTIRVQEQEEDFQEGKMNFRIAKIRRNEALDALMAIFKRREIVIRKTSEWDTFVDHMLSLKRIQKFNNNNELTYVWEKTGQETDHYHFALLYLWVALRIRGAAKNTLSALGSLPIISKVRVGSR